MIKKTLKIGKIGLFEVALPYLVIGSGQPAGLIVCLQHGGESASLLVIKQLIKEQKKLRGTAIILPMANPFGQIFDQRNEIIEGQDLNRSFPGNEKSDFTGRLAAQIFSLGKKADFVLDLHNFSRLSPVLAGFSANRGKNQKTVVKLLKLFNPEVVWQTNSDQSEDKRFKGSLDEALSKIGKPSIFIETPNISLVTEKQIERVKKGIFNIFERFNQKEAEKRRKDTPIFRAKYLYSDQSGIFVPKVKPSEKIKKGKILGTLILLPEFQEILVRSPYGGVVLTVKPKEVVRLGSKIGSIGEKVNVL